MNPAAMGDTGFELPSVSMQNTHGSLPSGAKCGALSGGADPTPIQAVAAPDPDLAAVIAAWPSLPAVLRDGIVAMVAAVGMSG